MKEEIDAVKKENADLKSSCDSKNRVTKVLSDQNDFCIKVGSDESHFNVS